MVTNRSRSVHESTLAPYDFRRTDVRAAKARSDDDNMESERGRMAFGIDGRTRTKEVEWE